MTATANETKHAKPKTEPAKSEPPKDLAKPDPTKDLAVYDPRADEGWQILDTGEGRMYWSLDPEADKADKHANTITGFAQDIASFDQEDQNTGELRTRHFILVQTTAPCMVVDSEKKNERGEAVSYIAPRGSLVWVGVRHALTALHAKVKNSPFVLEVMIRGAERIVLPNTGGQKVWRIAQACRPTKKRTMVVLKSTEPEDETTPF
jgi:hypothetical protein